MVIQIDRAYHAVCGNTPAGCRTLVLDGHEIALLTTDMLGLCRLIATALGIQPSPESIPDLQGVHRVGTVIPGPGVRYPVYLVIRSNPQSYAEVLGALAIRHSGGSLSVLVPTARFLTEDVERQARSTGMNIIALADVMALASNRLCCCADPGTLFSSLGQRTSGAFDAAGEIVARALVRDRSSPHRWQDLDAASYQALLAAACSYDIFADEKTKTVRKMHAVTEGVRHSYFRSIEAAASSRAYFDPAIAGPALASRKQIFQRARKSFDIKSGRSSWKVFKTVRTGEKHAVYAFRPDSDVALAFIFLPKNRET